MCRDESLNALVVYMLALSTVCVCVRKSKKRMGEGKPVINILFLVRMKLCVFFTVHTYINSGIDRSRAFFVRFSLVVLL